MITTHSIAAKHPGAIGALWGGIGVAVFFGAPITFILWGAPLSMRIVRILLGASLLGALFGTVLRSSYERMRWDVFGMIVAGLVPVIGMPLLLIVDKAAWFVEQGLTVRQAFETTIGMSWLAESLYKAGFLIGSLALVWICGGFIVGTIIQYLLKRASAAKSAPASQ